MNEQEKSTGSALLLMWTAIIVLLSIFIFSCKVSKVTCASQVRIPVTTVTVKPDSSRSYNTLYVPYCDSVLIYIQPKKVSQ
jgi:hypothetical protein